MPYFTKKGVGKDKGKTCVYKKDDKTKVGCTDGPIEKYLAALHVNESEGGEWDWIRNEPIVITDVNDLEVGFVGEWGLHDELKNDVKIVGFQYNEPINVTFAVMEILSKKDVNLVDWNCKQHRGLESNPNRCTYAYISKDTPFILSKTDNLNESEGDDWDWVREIEADALVPGEIYDIKTGNGYYWVPEKFIGKVWDDEYNVEMYKFKDLDGSGSGGKSTPYVKELIQKGHIRLYDPNWSIKDELTFSNNIEDALKGNFVIYFKDGVYLDETLSIQDKLFEMGFSFYTKGPNEYITNKDSSKKIQFFECFNWDTSNPRYKQMPSDQWDIKKILLSAVKDDELRWRPKPNPRLDDQELFITAKDHDATVINGDNLLNKNLTESQEDGEWVGDIKKDYTTDPSKGVVSPSLTVIKDVCEKEKFCKAQGPITFGQLKHLLKVSKNKKLFYDVGEGGYKATIRLLPWFFPQIALAGFIGSSIRAFNKILKPTIEETNNYKTWWGKIVLKVMKLAEGDLPINDPLSKIFFISDGLLHLMNDKTKLKFAKYISELASNKPEDEPVPEFFVENELRKYLNEKFLLNPPLQPKNINESEEFDWIKQQEPEKQFKKSNKYVVDVSHLRPTPMRFSHDPSLTKQDILSKLEELGYDVEHIDVDVATYFYIEPTEGGSSWRYDEYGNPIESDYWVDYIDGLMDDPTYGGQYKMVDVDEFMFLIDNNLINESDDFEWIREGNPINICEVIEYDLVEPGDSIIINEINPWEDGDFDNDEYAPIYHNVSAEVFAIDNLKNIHPTNTLNEKTILVHINEEYLGFDNYWVNQFDYKYQNKCMDGRCMFLLCSEDPNVKITKFNVDLFEDKKPLNEVAGISFEVREWSNIVHDEILNNPEEKVRIIIDGYDYPEAFNGFPIDYLVIDYHDTMTGYITEYSGYDKDGNYVVVLYIQPELVQGGSNYSLKTALNHELKHAWEDYNRVSKGLPNLDNTKESKDFYNKDFISLLSNVSMGGTIQWILKYYYFLSKLEQGAYLENVYDGNYTYEDLVRRITTEDFEGYKDRFDLDVNWNLINTKYNIPFLKKFKSPIDFIDYSAKELRSRALKMLKKINKMKYIHGKM